MILLYNFPKYHPHSSTIYIILSCPESTLIFSLNGVVAPFSRSIMVPAPLEITLNDASAPFSYLLMVRFHLSNALEW